MMSLLRSNVYRVIGFDCFDNLYVVRKDGIRAIYVRNSSVERLVLEETQSYVIPERNNVV